MSDKFDQQKEGSLAGVDLSRKGSVDEPIQPLISYINQHHDYFTTSSCSGRILIVDNTNDDKVQKKGCKWVMTSHSYVTPDKVCDSLKDIEDNAVFKFEPFVLHVQCRNLQDAQVMLQCGVSSGFRNSGISVGNKGRYITAIRSTHSLEAPLSNQGKLLVSHEYVGFLVKTANKKMTENLNRIERFFNNLKSALERSRDTDKTVSKQGRKQKQKRPLLQDNSEDTDINGEETNINAGITNHTKTGTDVVSFDNVEEIDIGDCLGFLDEG